MRWLVMMAILTTSFLSPELVFSEKVQGPGGYCPVGQVWPGYDPDWNQPGTITGSGQTFYSLIDPGEGCECAAGFELTTIDFFMTIPDDTSFPTTVAVSMGLAEAVPDQSGNLTWVPGATVCESPVRSFGVPYPKDFLGFGVGLDCDCYEMGPPVFLFFTIHSQMDPFGGLYTAGGGAPDPGQFLVQIEGQWVDLVAEGILTSGNLVVSGYARCCEPPVGTSAESWGGIKALYR